MATYGGGQRIDSGGSGFNNTSGSGTICTAAADGYALVTGFMQVDNSGGEVVISSNGNIVAALNGNYIPATPSTIARAHMGFTAIVPSGGSCTFTRTGACSLGWSFVTFRQA